MIQARDASEGKPLDCSWSWCAAIIFAQSHVKKGSFNTSIPRSDACVEAQPELVTDKCKVLHGSNLGFPEVHGRNRDPMVLQVPAAKRRRHSKQAG